MPESGTIGGLRHGAAPSRFEATLTAMAAGGDPMPDSGVGPERMEAVDRLLDPDRTPLHDLLEQARAATDRTFGRAVGLYAPCYLSSHCVNHCLYCGFRHGAAMDRRRLEVAEALDELRCLAARGIERVILVAGDHPAMIPPDYIERILTEGKSLIPELDLEVAPAPVRDYRRWARAGAVGVTCYQEVYAPALYAPLHPKGPKSSWGFRLGALERAGAAGFRRLGAGILLGLSPYPHREIRALVAHALLLSGLFPRVSITVSLPRLLPAAPEFRPATHVPDEALLRYYAVLRLSLPWAGLTLSTREPAALRARLLQAGVTHMSAGSVTAPGGYAGGETGPGQFAVTDRRSVAEVTRALGALGYSVTSGRGG